MRLLILLLTFLPHMVFGQTATFYADSTDIWYWMSGNKEEYKQALEMEWRINGQKLRFGSKPISVKVDSNTIDTIYYRQYAGREWDTFICNINTPVRCTFLYNPCCQAFIITDEPERRIKGGVKFQVTGQSTDETYLGTVYDVSMVVQAGDTASLRPDISPMLPNVYEITLKAVEVCGDTTGCITEDCKYGNDGHFGSFSYKPLSEKFRFLLLPVSEQPVQIIYDPRNHRVILK